MPLGPIETTLDFFHQTIASVEPDLIFLQMEPMPFITRQRYMSHKCAMHEVEEYSLKGVPDFGHPNPYSWEEAVVNLITIDMIRAN